MRCDLDGTVAQSANKPALRMLHRRQLDLKRVHIPWPEVRYWQSSLPTTITQAIFSGLLGNDIIGFQTRRDAQNFLDLAPHWAIFPGLLIFLTVLSINYIGDGMRDALDPRKTQ